MSAAGQGCHNRSAAVVNQCNGHRYSSRPRRCSGPPTVIGRTCHGCLQERLLSTKAATDNRKIVVSGAIFHGLPDRLMRRLQSVQNAAARLITSALWCDHITPILRQLYWLPVQWRVDFKIAILVFQCFTVQAPEARFSKILKIFLSFS